MLGKRVVAVRKDGSRVEGKLVKIRGNRLVLKRVGDKNKAHTNAVIPLVLYDLLAIGTGPYGYGGYGGYGYNPYGYGGYGYGPYGYGGGYLW